MVVGIGIGEIAGSTVGRALSERITWRPARAVDHGLGLIGHTVAVLVVTWMLAVPLASAPFPWLASAVRVVDGAGQVDKVMPSGVRDISSRMRQLFDDSGFPAILDPLAPTPERRRRSSRSGAVRLRVAASRQGSRCSRSGGVAQSCSRRIEGSGFVFGPGKVLTNAHVVAGTESVTVEQGSSTLTATVVLYDPDRDLAVLDVPGLTRRL